MLDVIQLVLDHIAGPALPPRHGVATFGIRIAALDHESGNGAVEFDSIVVALFREGHEILDRFRSLLGEKAQNDGSDARFHNRYFFSVFHCSSNELSLSALLFFRA